MCTSIETIIVIAQKIVYCVKNNILFMFFFCHFQTTIGKPVANVRKNVYDVVTHFYMFVHPFKNGGNNLSLHEKVIEPNDEMHLHFFFICMPFNRIYLVIMMRYLLISRDLPSTKIGLFYTSKTLFFYV